MLVAALLVLLAPAVLAFGTPHESVVVMTTQNFSTLLEDPANGLFLIKFYAPWYVALAAGMGLGRLGPIDKVQG